MDSGNRSLGLETVYMLLRKNCTVWIAGRSQGGFDDAKSQLSARPDVTEAMVANLHFHKLDLAEMKSAYESANDFASHNSRLDILVANAGVSLQRGDQLSSDGYEQTFQVNQLGHFSFITPLLPLMEKTAREHGEARVVITSSAAHAFAKSGIDFDALTKATPHTGLSGLGDAMTRYGASKLANMLFARELDRRWAYPLRQQGVFVSSDSVHPGTYQTLHGPIASTTNRGNYWHSTRRQWFRLGGPQFYELRCALCWSSFQFLFSRRSHDTNIRRDYARNQDEGTARPVLCAETELARTLYLLS
jgi:NAD(P)-dependent dehydrogenase (short-subunit alcohol dehydrogenase family)